MRDREALEGDGLIDGLYDLLWMKNAQGRSCPGIVLPDTIVYKYRQPAYWYFSSSKDGLIKKKNKQKLTNASIYESLAREKGAASEICAYHIATRDGEAHEAQRVTTVEYFDEERLKHFLFHRDKLNNGIVQRFVDPPEQSNSVIRATWSPGVCLLERRTSAAKLADRRATMAARAATFEGAEGASSAGAMSGAQLAGHVTQLCANVVEHVWEVARSCRIARMVLYFKPDREGRFLFLWCSSLRLQPPHAPGAPPAPAPHAPLDVAHTLTLAEPPPAPAAHAPPAMELPTHGTTRRSQPVETRICPACGNPYGDGGELEVSYKQALMHARLSQGPPGRASAAAATVRPLELEPPSALFEEAILGHRQGGPDRWHSTHPRSSAQLGSQPVDGDVPEVLRRLHPGMTSEKLARLSKDAAFLYKTAKVCCNCAVAIARTATRMLSAEEEPPRPARRPPPAPPVRSAPETALPRAERASKPATAAPPPRLTRSEGAARPAGAKRAPRGNAGRAWIAAREASFTPDYGRLAGPSRGTLFASGGDFAPGPAAPATPDLLYT